jgi:hypothetical protein
MLRRSARCDSHSDVRPPALRTSPWSWTRWLFAPLWIAQVFTAAKTCDVNPILGDMGLNRRGLHVWRGRLAHRLARWRRRRLAHLVSEHDRAAFEQDGLVVRKNFVPDELFSRIRSELAEFRGDAVESPEGDTINRRICLDQSALRRLPACCELVTSSEFQGLVRYVAGYDAPPNLHVQTIFTKAMKAKPDHQTRLHMDTFHPTMKAWLFLHDVAEEDGPFTYVPGSHRRTARRDAWERRMSVEASDPRTPSTGGSFRVAAAELKRLGCGPQTTVAVAANTLVVADTYGFHARGVSVQPSTRIAIYATSRPNPFLPWSGSPWPDAARRWASQALRARTPSTEGAVGPASPPRHPAPRAV